MSDSPRPLTELPDQDIGIVAPWDDLPSELFCRINSPGDCIVRGDDDEPIGLRVELPDGRRMMLPFMYLPTVPDV